MSRRSVLLSAGALAFLAACGGGKDKEVKVGNETDDTTKSSDELSTIIASFNLQSGIDERVTFALFEGIPASLMKAGPEVKVAFVKPGTQGFTTPVVAERKSEGIEERPYYVVHHNFDVPGDWGIRATVAGMKPGDAMLSVADAASIAYPTIGTKLPSTKTPTSADAMGVNPLCSRSEGTCPFHAKSLDSLLGNGKPTIVMIATPALCTSATCGPVLDILMAEVEGVASQVNVVHIEVFTDSSGKTVSPALEPFHIQNEPVTYFADKSGTVTERFNGGFDRTEARAAIAKLLA